MRNSYIGKSIILVVGAMITFSMITALSGLATADPQETKMGNFTLSYDATTSTLYNVSYANSNHTLKVADNVTVSGKNASLAARGHQDFSKTLTLSNVTLFVTEDSDILVLATTNAQPSQTPYVNVSLPSAASAVNLTPAVKNAFWSASNSLMQSFLSNTIYRMNVTDGFLLYMTNSPSTLSSDRMTISFYNDSLSAGAPLLVAMTPSGTLKYSFDKQLQNVSLSTDPITYNSATGDVSGTYLSMVFDSSTGIIHNYTNLYTGTVVFSSIYTYGNGSFGDGFVTPLFPSLEPVTIGNALYFANSTAVYQTYNNMATTGNFFTSNGTLVLTLADGMTASLFHPPHYALQSQSRFGHNFSNYSGLTVGTQYSLMAAPTMISINGTSFNGELFVTEGQVSLTGNTVAVTTDSYSRTQFVAQPLFLNASLQMRTQLQQAIQDGKIGAMISVGDSHSRMNLTSYYNGSLSLNLQNAYTNRVQVMLSSNVQLGANIAVFIPNSVIMNNSHFTVRLDSQVMTQLQEANGILNSTSTTQGQYFISQASGGVILLIHVPHFSTHTIEISGTVPAAGGPPLLWIGIGVALAAAALVIIAIVLRRGGKAG